MPPGPPSLRRSSYSTLVGELPGGEDVGEPGFVLGQGDDDVADAVLLEQDGEGVIADHVHDLEVARLVRCAAGWRSKWLQRDHGFRGRELTAKQGATTLGRGRKVWVLVGARHLISRAERRAVQPTSKSIAPG